MVGYVDISYRVTMTLCHQFEVFFVIFFLVFTYIPTYILHIFLCYNELA